MQRGRPLNPADLLPDGMGIDDALIIAAAIAAFMIIWSIGQIFITRDRLAPRLKSVAERRSALKVEYTQARRRQKNTNTETMNLMRQVVAQLKLLQQHQTGVLQKKLLQAGYRSKDAIIVFAFAKLVSPFLGLGIGLALAEIDWSHPFSSGALKGWFILIGCGLFCARLPEIIVANARSKRNAAIRKGLPDALDLMMICAEAGLSLAAALDRVARELGRVSPELAEEFSLTSVELGFLPDRATALKNFGERVDMKEVRGFVNVIAQTEKYGTPIAQALRVLSQEYRTERMLRAEQKAARLPAMMTVPMIVFILPTLFIIVMAPAIISVMDRI